MIRIMTGPVFDSQPDNLLNSLWNFCRFIPTTQANSEQQNLCNTLQSLTSLSLPSNISETS